MSDATVDRAEALLTALDRCDRCNAPARVRAILIAGDLLLCGHHAREAGHALRLKSISIYDPERYVAHGK